MQRRTDSWCAVRRAGRVTGCWNAWTPPGNLWHGYEVIGLQLSVISKGSCLQVPTITDD